MHWDVIIGLAAVLFFAALASGWLYAHRPFRAFLCAFSVIAAAAVFLALAAGVTISDLAPDRLISAAPYFILPAIAFFLTPTFAGLACGAAIHSLCHRRRQSR